MVEIRNRIERNKFIEFLKNLGIDVHFNTKAKGNSGFCTNSRIDISKELPEHKINDVLLHEFAHFVHFQLEPNISKDYGSLKILFNITEDSEIEKIKEELYQITLIVFDGSSTRRIEAIKESLNKKIKEERNNIKKVYPNFVSTERFEEFNKYVRFSNAKYLLKYDKVILKGGWFSMDTTISVKNIEKDFPKMPQAFISYIKLKSYERHRNRINSRENRIKRYLRQPTELFARFFQFYCTDIEATQQLAPISFRKFSKLLDEKYYPHLNRFFEECLISTPKNE
jgi:hypothetical protein